MKRKAEARLYMEPARRVEITLKTSAPRAVTCLQRSCVFRGSSTRGKRIPAGDSCLRLSFCSVTGSPRAHCSPELPHKWCLICTSSTPTPGKLSGAEVSSLSGLSASKVLTCSKAPFLLRALHTRPGLPYARSPACHKVISAYGVLQMHRN